MAAPARRAWTHGCQVDICVSTMRDACVWNACGVRVMWGLSQAYDRVAAEHRGEHMRVITHAAACTVALVMGTALASADVTYDTKRCHIHLSGAINMQMVEDLDAAVIRLLRGKCKSVREITLKSEGGQAVAGWQIASRARMLGTRTRAIGECMSACFNIWAGGLQRTIGMSGWLGVHRSDWLPEFKHNFDPATATALSATSNNRAVLMLESLGVTTDVIALANSTPHAEMAWLDAAQIQDNEWPVNICVGETGDDLYGCRKLVMITLQARRLMHYEAYVAASDALAISRQLNAHRMGQ